MALKNSSGIAESLPYGDRMRFKGQLLLPNETGPGLPVSLDLAAHHLALESENGGLGAWPLEVVDVRRLQGDMFAMTVAGEDLHFVAEDALTFAYSGLPAIKRVSKVRPRSGFRTWLSKIWSEAPTRPAEPARSVVGEEPVVTVELTQTDAPAPETPEIPLDEWGGLDTSQDRAIHVPESSFPMYGPAVDEIGADPSSVEARMPVEEPRPEKETSGCPAMRNDGLPCQSPILTSSGYCTAHDPHRTVVDGYRAAQEARTRLKAQSTARLNRVYTRLDKAMRQVERGELDPEIAMAMAQLARTMCAILDLDDEPGRSPEGPLRGAPNGAT